MPKPFFPQGFKSPLVLSIGTLLFILFLWGAVKFLRDSSGDRQASEIPANTSNLVDEDEPSRQVDRI